MTTYEQKARVTGSMTAIRIAAAADAEIARLQAQIDALAGALDHATKLNSFREFNDYIPTMRAALASAGR